MYVCDLAENIECVRVCFSRGEIGCFGGMREREREGKNY